MNKSNIDIVISRYNEDLKWTLESPFNEFKYIVYNKGDNDYFEKKYVEKVISLKNVGRNDHTYLYHIVNNFDSLNNITVFLPGSVNISEKKEKSINLLNKIKENEYNNAIFMSKYVEKGVLQEFFNFKLDEWCASDNSNSSKNPEKKLTHAFIRPFGKWFLYNFGNKMINFYQYHGIFSIDRKDIKKYNVERYNHLLKILEVSSNPEVGHYIERSWHAIFYPFLHTKLLTV